MEQVARQDAPAERTEEELRLDAARRRAYLAAYLEHGTVGAALAAVGVPRRVLVKEWRLDPDFVEEEGFVQQDRADVIEAHALKRAMGFEELLVDKSGNPYFLRDADGQPVLDENFEPVYATRKTYSDNMLGLVLKARVAAYKEKAALEVSGPGGGPVQTETDVRVRFVMPEGMSAADYPTDGAGA